MKKIQRITWDEFDWAAKHIAELIRNSKIKFDFVTGIPRGGLFLAIYLSHLLDLRYFEYKYAVRNRGIVIPETVLICDDIIDSGKTIRQTYRDFEYDETYFATLGYKESSPFSPWWGAYVWKDDMWIQMPWEKDNEEQNR